MYMYTATAPSIGSMAWKDFVRIWTRTFYWSVSYWLPWFLVFCSPNLRIGGLFSLSDTIQVLHSQSTSFNSCVQCENTHQQWAQQRRPTISVRSHKARASTAACNVKMDTYSRPISTRYSKQPTHHKVPALTPHKLQQLHATWKQEPTTSNKYDAKPEPHWPQNKRNKRQSQPTIQVLHSQSTSFNSCVQCENKTNSEHSNEDLP